MGLTFAIWVAESEFSTSQPINKFRKANEFSYSQQLPEYFNLEKVKPSTDTALKSERKKTS